MDTNTIRELIGIVERSAITTFELEESGYRIKIGKAVPGMPDAMQTILAQGSAPIRTPDPQTVLSPPGAAEKLPAQTALLQPDEPETPGENILSPMLGVFYAAPSPDREPFVKTGDRVKKGDVLCIIEAMKLMNEITADKDGEIVKIYPQNGQIVEFEQVIFRIRSTEGV